MSPLRQRPSELAKKCRAAETDAYRTGNPRMLGRIINNRLGTALEKRDQVLIHLDQWQVLYAMAPAQSTRTNAHSGDASDPSADGTCGLLQTLSSDTAC
jgi:hypothetical protein